MKYDKMVSYLCSIVIAFYALSVNTYANAQIFYNLTPGWNLLANAGSTSIDVATTFGDSKKYVSVWKWNKVASKWAFYTPFVSSSLLTTYAQAKGLDVLVSIDSKEGFWINASVSSSVAGPLQFPPAAGVLPVPITLQESDLASGWNLVGSDDNLTPTLLNAGISASLTTAGKAISTIWAWDVTANNWKFYAPSLDAQGGTVLSDYITKNRFKGFTDALTNTDGFWVNVTQTPITYGHFYVQYAYSGTSAVAYLATYNNTDLGADTSFDWSKDKDITSKVVVSGQVGGDSHITIYSNAIFKEQQIDLDVKGYVFPWMGAGFRYQCIADNCQITSGIKTSAVTDIIWTITPHPEYIYNSANNHYYHFVIDPSITPTDAAIAASALVYKGKTGYLAAISSQQENNFLSSNMLPGQFFIFGASDASSEGTWKFMQGPKQNQVLNYLGWHVSEPGGGTGENYVFINWDGTWADIPNIPYAGGYVVEFGD